MKAQKHIVSYQDIDLDIVEVTLLSAKEYFALKNRIKPRKDLQWLRSTYSDIDKIAGSVDADGYVPYDTLKDSHVGVSPALRIRNLESLGMNPGDVFVLARHTWTVISDKLAQCDDIVGYTAFREDWRAPDANVYEKSDVKKWIENWAASNGIEVNANG